MRCHRSSSRAVASAPATTSVWPPRYFVAECMTRSAPSARGCVCTGVAHVESTARTAPASWAIVAAAAMSVTSQVGLAGVSAQTRRVGAARTFAARSSSDPLSYSSTRTPHAARKPVSQPRSPQYMLRGARMRSPGARPGRPRPRPPGPKRRACSKRLPPAKRAAPRAHRRWDCRRARRCARPDTCRRCRARRWSPRAAAARCRGTDRPRDRAPEPRACGGKAFRRR